MLELRRDLQERWGALQGALSMWGTTAPMTVCHTGFVGSCKARGWCAVLRGVRAAEVEHWCGWVHAA